MSWVEPTFDVILALPLILLTSPLLLILAVLIKATSDSSQFSIGPISRSAADNPHAEV